MDLDKIISAWEHCTSDEGDCDDCPYNNDFNGCMLNLKLDTIKILKFYKEHEHDVCANCLYEEADDLSQKEVEQLRNDANARRCKCGWRYCPSCGARMDGVKWE